MASVLGKIIGSRGHETSRQGSKDSGITATVQTFTHIVTMRWDWDTHARYWNVRITRAPVQLARRDEVELLWEGVSPE